MPGLGASTEAEGAGTTWLRQYVHDHCVLTRGELELFRRSARTQSRPSVRAEVAVLAAEVGEDRAALLAMVDELAIDRSPVQEYLAVAAERVGRLKPNGTVLRRSPLTDLVELEGMALAVRGKQLLWHTLRQVADAEPLLNPYHLDRLLRRAKDQEARLDELRAQVTRIVFALGSGAGPRP